MPQNAIQILETAYLLLQGVPKYDIIFVLGLGKYVNKAERVKEILEKKNLNKNSKRQKVI